MDHRGTVSPGFIRRVAWSRRVRLPVPRGPLVVPRPQAGRPGLGGARAVRRGRRAPARPGHRQQRDHPGHRGAGSARPAVAHVPAGQRFQRADRDRGARRPVRARLRVHRAGRRRRVRARGRRRRRPGRRPLRRRHRPGRLRRRFHRHRERPARSSGDRGGRRAARPDPRPRGAPPHAAARGHHGGDRRQRLLDLDPHRRRHRGARPARGAGRAGDHVRLVPGGRDAAGDRWSAWRSPWPGSWR